MDVESVALPKDRPALTSPFPAWTAILAVSALIEFTTLYYFHAWETIGVPSFLPAFLDWHGVVAASDCTKLGYNVYLQNPCDALNRVHNYSAIWLKLSALGLTRQNEWEVGVFISSTFLISAAFMLRPKSLKEFVLCLTALNSPAIMFGVEQANVDLLIFIVILAATFLFTQSHRISHFVGITLCVLASALKFYPVAAVTPLLWTMTSRRRIVALSIVIAFALLTWIVLDFDNLQAVYSIAEKPGYGSNVAIGSSLIFLALGNAFPSLAWLSRIWISFVLFFVLAGFSFYYANRIEERSPITFGIDLASAGFIAGSSIIVLIFFLITSYDYKTIFLLLLLPYLMPSQANNVHASGVDRRMAQLALALIISVLWSTGIVNVLSNIAPDYRLLILLVKYLLSWALIFVLMSLGAALALRRWNSISAELTGGSLPVR